MDNNSIYAIILLNNKNDVQNIIFNPTYENYLDLLLQSCNNGIHFVPLYYKDFNFQIENYDNIFIMKNGSFKIEIPITDLIIKE